MVWIRIPNPELFTDTRLLPRSLRARCRPDPFLRPVGPRRSVRHGPWPALHLSPVAPANLMQAGTARCRAAVGTVQRPAAGTLQWLAVAWWTTDWVPASSSARRPVFLTAFRQKSLVRQLCPYYFVILCTFRDPKLFGMKFKSSKKILVRIRIELYQGFRS